MNEKFVTKKEAAQQLKASTASIDRKRIPWQDQPVPGRIRFKVDVLHRPYFYLDDVTGLLVPPAEPKSSRRGRRKKLFQVEKTEAKLFGRQNLLPV